MSDEQNIFEEENTNTVNASEGATDTYMGPKEDDAGAKSTYGQYTGRSNQQYGQYTDQPNQQYGRYTDQANQQYSYGQQYYNPYQQPGSGKKQGQGFGIASLVLGIISLVLFCTCINFFLGLLALIFGIIQIVRYEKKGLAIGGIVTSAISFVLFFVCWAMLMTSDDFLDTLQQDLYQYDEIYDELQEDYYNDQDENHTL